VRKSAVVAVRSNGNDQVHAALILSDANADVAAIVGRANEQLEAHQRVRGWTVWPDLEFPRTPST
jgi:long-chain acyl-CoA synthetase